MVNYSNNLTEVYRSQVSEKESSISFRFGDENSVKSGKTVTILKRFGTKNIVIKTGHQ